MRVTVTTPTGNIGRVLTDRLLEAGAEVTLICRNPEKVREFTARGARAVKGSMEDVDAITATTKGTQALFWLIPPDFSHADFRGFQNRLGRAAATAIRANRIPRVVFLSSVGAQHAEGTGPIKGLHDVERLLEDGAANITHLRPTYFFENFLHALPTIREAGSIFLPVSGGTRLPMIATRDIGEVAAERLLDDSWTGRWVLELLGPEDLTFDGAAAAISEGIGRPVKHVKVPEETAKQALLRMGLLPGPAGTMLELYRGIESGLIRPEKERTPESTTPTRLAHWAAEVMRPMLAA